MENDEGAALRLLRLLAEGAPASSCPRLTTRTARPASSPFW